jgi:4-diphosphocytidyl-2-C-methyl-D-erythritol kinase
MSFTIERAVDAQIATLCAIERAAVQMFRGHAIWPAYAAAELPPDFLREAIARGHAWVARLPGGEVAGFICLDNEEGGDAVGIAELDVHPDHGRRGIGGALLEHACAWARAAGYRRVDLGTLADVPWNAPFYRRHGFAVVDKNDPAFAFARERDRENGFPDALRVFMSRPLPPPGPGDWTVWPAPAKLNLFLRITGRRADGYHELQTVFRLLDWGDELRLRVREDGQVARAGGPAGVPADQDLAVRAARLLKEHSGCALGVDIALDKRIPMGGGLGGGSSDAASVLVGLNELWGTGLDEDALAELGRQLGADVPVFVRGRSAWASGIGERLRPIRLPRRWYVVLDPHEPVSTPALFQAAELTRDAAPATISSFVSGKTTENAFEPVVRARHPRVADALDWLGRHGRAQLSGSGGCVFLESASREQLEAVVRDCPARFTAQLAEGVGRSPLHVARDRLARARQAGVRA